MGILSNIRQSVGTKAKDLAKSAAKTVWTDIKNNPEESALAAINLAGGGYGVAPAYVASKLAGKFGLGGAEAAELPAGSPPPSQTSTDKPTGGFDLGGILGGIGGWLKENPALVRGLATTAIGAAQGQHLLTSSGLGGQAFGMEQAEQQRRAEEANKLKMQLLGSLGNAGAGKPISEYLTAARAQLGNNASADQINRTAAALKAQDLGGVLGYQKEGWLSGIGIGRNVPYVL